MGKISDGVVLHSRFTEARDVIQQAVARGRDGDPQLLPLEGHTRVGKTKLLRGVASRVQSTSSAGVKSVISIVSPKHLTGRALPDACLTSIGMSPGLFRNHVDATDAFVKAVKRRGTELIIFDETQHMLERGSSTTVRAAADFLKLLFDDTHVSIVLAGLPSLSGLFQANEQLADRARAAFKFYPYEWHGADYKNFRAALAGALQHLTDLGWKTFAFDDADFAQRMYVASAGRFGLISKIFMEVQASCVGQALYPAFEKAYHAVGRGRIDFNPLDPQSQVKTEHMALVYTKVMAEAGVKV